MSKSGYCQLWLTCANKKEANNIAKTLLVKRLVACAKQIPVNSDFRWKNNLEHNNEVLLIMESKVDLFDKVENEVAKLHSYETFVLEASPVLKISQKAQAWLEKEIK